MRTQQQGFTLVELILAIAVITMLASIAMPQLHKTLRRTQEATTRGNLAALRAGVAAFLTNSGGLYPARLEDLTAQPLPVLEAMPIKNTPPYHPQGNSVTNGGRAALTGSRGDWFYFNNPAEPEYGQVVVNCIHTDLRGVAWTAY